MCLLILYIQLLYQKKNHRNANSKCPAFGFEYKEETA